MRTCGAEKLPWLVIEVEVVAERAGCFAERQLRLGLVGEEAIPETRDRLGSPSPTMIGGRGSRSGGQLQIAFPSGGALLQGTELQLGGGLRSTMSQAHTTNTSAAGSRTPADYGDRSRAEFGALPPPPRKAGLLPDSELISGDEIRAANVVALFKTEPMLKGRCTALYVRDTGCIWDKCNYCVASLRDAASTDPRDLAQADRLSSGSLWLVLLQPFPMFNVRWDVRTGSQARTSL